jgi:hypothetical protein
MGVLERKPLAMPQLRQKPYGKGVHRFRPKWSTGNQNSGLNQRNRASQFADELNSYSGLDTMLFSSFVRRPYSLFRLPEPLW